MYTGYPLQQLDLLRCSTDEGRLEIRGAADVADGRIREGELTCVSCGRRYPVREGIVKLLEESALDRESQHELVTRDEEAKNYETVFVGDPLTSAMEMVPTLGAVGARAGDTLFELGCGTGRYTVQMARTCGALVAVDFSGESLRLLARKLDPGAPVGLVQADVTQLRLAPSSFDAGLSTLVSNLSSPTHRSAMYRLAARSLRNSGRFIFGTHAYRIPDRLRGVEQEGYYTEGGIFRRYFTMSEIAREVGPWFGKVDVRPVQIPVPLGRRLRLPVLKIAEIFSRIPVLNQFGHLLLVSAFDPVASAKEAPRRRDAATLWAAAPLPELERASS